LFNKLQGLAGADNPYSLLDLYGKGHTVVVAGAAAYITRCYPVEATKAEYANCTHQIPVQVNGSLRFADPFNWVLSDYGTIVPCSDVTPVRWKIKENWYCASPRAQRCEAPEQLTPQAVVWEEVDFTTGLGQSLFTQAQIDAHKAFQKSQASRQAVIQKVTNAALNHATEGGELGITIDTGDMNEIKYVVGGFLFPLFPLLGQFWTIASGTFLAIVALKVLIGCILRGIVIYLDKGCGFWMLGAIWSTLFTVLRTPGALASSAVAALRQPLQPASAPPRECVMSYAELLKKLDAEKLAAQNVQEVEEYERMGRELAAQREADNAAWDNSPESWDNPVPAPRPTGEGERRGPDRNP
jgi:hypothetical protein